MVDNPAAGTYSGPANTYSGTAKTLHWLIVALMIAQYIFAWTMPHIGRNTQVTTLISLHFTFGIIILAVAAIRVIVRLTHHQMEPEDGLPPWQVAASRLMHRLLYALLFIIPILGWMNASWRGMPIVMFGFELPALLPKRAPGFGWTGDVHSLLSNYLMLALVGLHAVAGLYHHFILRDGVLRRMLPGARTP
jgi:cytochrome b561